MCVTVCVCVCVPVCLLIPLCVCFNKLSVVKLFALNKKKTLYDCEVTIITVKTPLKLEVGQWKQCSMQT